MEAMYQWVFSLAPTENGQVMSKRRQPRLGNTSISNSSFCKWRAKPLYNYMDIQADLQLEVVVKTQKDTFCSWPHVFASIGYNILQLYAVEDLP